MVTVFSPSLKACVISVTFLAPSSGPPSSLPLGSQTPGGSSTLSKKRPPPPPPGHKRTLSDPPSPLPHGPQSKGGIPWGESGGKERFIKKR
ncbi:hypothetical protein JZ751_000753 [Albula glossodonta]|uniref:Uncharacterized protein n=1 Tax=Albula glossodonta TaxID=121402 RepID=A0A8T2PWZ0_9TELE|nr:hypothetical protein JZ751_000753 [Albula glossodonta]